MDFERLSRQFDQDLAAAENRERLASFSFHIEFVEARLDSLRQSEYGADWVFKNTRPLQASNRGCPEAVVRRIGAMVKARNPELSIARQATEQEIEVIEASEGRKIQRPHYISEPIAQIDGLDALYPENDLRELLVIDLESNLAGFKKLAITDLTPAELRRWSQWVSTVDTLFERATASMEAGRRLLKPDNLEAFDAVMEDQADRNRFRAFLRTLH